MKDSNHRLLVYCYFCPDNPHRPGGVEQVIGPLLSNLRLRGWSIDVLHSGQCYSIPNHQISMDRSYPNQPDAMDSETLALKSRQLADMARRCDAVMSVDLMLPCPVPKPSLLMSNTLEYKMEATAVQANQWTEIVVPTKEYASAVHSVNRTPRVTVISYGLPVELLRLALKTPSAKRKRAGTVVRLPHRPDRRKGQLEAVRGLARVLPRARDLSLEISWLDENRYSTFRGEIESLTRQLGVSEKVSIRSWLDGSQRFEAITRSSATLQLGRFRESFGLSIVESVLFGRPAITCNQPAVREVVGKDLPLLEISDPLGWFGALADYFSGEVDDYKMTEARERLAETLSESKMAEMYDLVLGRMVESA